MIKSVPVGFRIQNIANRIDFLVTECVFVCVLIIKEKISMIYEIVDDFESQEI